MISVNRPDRPGEARLVLVPARYQPHRPSFAFEARQPWPVQAHAVETRDGHLFGCVCQAPHTQRAGAVTFSIESATPAGNSPGRHSAVGFEGSLPFRFHLWRSRSPFSASATWLSSNPQHEVNE